MKWNGLRGGALVSLLTLALVGCGGKGGGSSDAHIRFLNTYVDAASVTISIDDTVIGGAVPFEQFTNYQDVSSGTHEYKVGVNGTTSNIVDVNLATSSDGSYTYIPYGHSGVAGALLVSDSNVGTPNAGNFQLRVINLATSPSAVDVYLTTPNADLSQTAPTIGNIVFGGTSAFATIPTASYQVRLTTANTKDVIFDTGTQSFADRSSLEAVVYSKGSARLVNVTMLNLDGTGAALANRLAEFKVVNGSRASSPLNVLVDGTLQLANVPAGGVSAYNRLIAGTHAITVEATSTPGATLLTLSPPLAAGTDTSIVLTGTSGALAGLVIPDSNFPPSAGRARVRFVNASPDFDSLDVYVNFGRQLSALATQTASAYIELTADTGGTIYEFDFNVANTGTIALKLTNVSLVVGKVYTVYVVGPATSVQGIVAQDN